MDTLTAKVLAVVSDKRAERRIRKKLPRARLVFADVTGAVDAATLEAAVAALADGRP